MPGFLLQVGAQASCAHQGAMQVQSTNTKVMAGGAAVATAADQCKIAGCPQVKPADGSPWACTDVKWITTATRVKVNGQFALLSTGSALCTGVTQPPPAPLIVKMTQTKVKGM